MNVGRVASRSEHTPHALKVRTADKKKKRTTCSQVLTVMCAVALWYATTGVRETYTHVGIEYLFLGCEMKTTEKHMPFVIKTNQAETERGMHARARKKKHRSADGYGNEMTRARFAAFAAATFLFCHTIAMIVLILVGRFD